MTRSTRRRAAAALVVLGLGCAAAGTASAQEQPATGAGPTRTWLALATGPVAETSAAVRASGASVVRELPGIGQVVLRADAAQVAALETTGTVRSITLDSTVHLSGAAYTPATDPGSPFNVSTAVGARAMWKAGFTGDGVDVAVIDSGVTPLPGGPRLVVGPDLSFDAQDPKNGRIDEYGHGTHLASIIAGEDTTSDARTSSATETGIAPDARVASIKVGDVNGGVDVSQVVAAIDWAVVNRSNHLNLRVINLSFGTDTTQPWQLDPLAFAAESASRKGVVVVAAAGNTGGVGLDDPAYDPSVLAVGATDPRGTTGPADDVVASYSSRGNGVRNPDLVAPGTGIVGLRVPGSVIDGETGAGGSRWLRGTGTSQAAAVVSGAAALLLQQRPSLTPDQLKAVLRASAAPIAGASAAEQGAGRLDLAKAMVTPVPASVPTAPAGTGLGSLDASRGSQVLVLDGVPLTGEKDVFGGAVTSAQLAAVASGQISPEALGAYATAFWTYTDGVQGAELSWGRLSLPAAFWSGTTAGTWSGRSWSGRSWSGRSWSGRSWSGRYWSDKLFQPAEGTAPAAASATTTAACSALPAWSAATAYNGGGSVTYGGRRWTARFWTQGNVPGDRSGVWGTGTSC
ncbi:subtilisin family serine protease [Motilibacter peucedani]|uniref:Subtilisin family serine protease n=1 Tax=Motilibacter peucedani TaxID=598650 RepID=A0A420XM23_9ACTN|nr:S8 family serine peptidase [Motilibacter peucedani]RKS72419.1 subtilisin family serine protease [Motilibacter peucedani]